MEYPDETPKCMGRTCKLYIHRTEAGSEPSALKERGKQANQ